MKEVRQSIGGLGNLMFKQAYIMGKVLDGEIPDVYVQSEKYWDNYSEQIKAMFSEGIGYSNDVSLHIRRGDYLNSQGFHVDLSETDYYQKAVSIFPDETFLVFCKDNQGTVQDEKDREWCIKFLTPLIGELGHRWNFAPFGNTEVEDLNMMASCKSNIMANSTFSWFAAYLNPNPSKVIICPKKWFTDEVQRTELLHEWVKI